MLAERFKNKDEHLILEGLNEAVNDNSKWNHIPKPDLEAMNDWNQLFVDAVRSTGGRNSDRYLLINTYAALPSKESLRVFRLPDDTAEDKILVGVHCYFMKDNLSEQFDVIRKYSAKYHFVIGEFAFKDDTENRAETVSEFVKNADELNIPVTWWDDGGTVFGILDRNKLEWSRKDVLDAMMGK